MLHFEADFDVVVERLAPCFMIVGCPEGNGLVGIGDDFRRRRVFLRDTDAAIPVAVLHVRPTENYETGLEFLNIDQKGHFSVTSCVEPV